MSSEFSPKKMQIKKTVKRIYALLILSLFTGTTYAQFVTQTGVNDLNTFPNDLTTYMPHTLNAPSTYGTVLGLRHWGGIGGSDWRTQLAFSTDNDFYYRQSTNNGGTIWSQWNKIYHSGNLNNSNTDFNAKTLTAKELTINSNESENGVGISHIYWQSHSLIMGSPKGTYAHNSLVLRPGGATNGFLNSGLDIQIAHGIDNYESRIHLSGSGDSFLNSGNVGIGTKNPQNKLDVNGTIHSKEVKVDMNGWSDFVFKKDYNLPSLVEVEEHISKNGHLQNIPNEKEVLKNGVNLGEMDAKLLQKIEELTLYVIDLNKKLEDQNKEIGLMKKKLESKK